MDTKRKRRPVKELEIGEIPMNGGTCFLLQSLCCQTVRWVHTPPRDLCSDQLFRHCRTSYIQYLHTQVWSCVGEQFIRTKTHQEVTADLWKEESQRPSLAELVRLHYITTWVCFRPAKIYTANSLLTQQKCIPLGLTSVCLFLFRWEQDSCFCPSARRAEPQGTTPFSLNSCDPCAQSIMVGPIHTAHVDIACQCGGDWDN